MQHHIPANLGHLEAGRSAGSFLLDGPNGTKTSVLVQMHITTDRRILPVWSCANSHAKDGYGYTTPSCAPLNFKGGTGWMITEKGPKSIKANVVEYTRPYEGKWLIVDIENSNSLKPFGAGSGPGVPSQSPTTSRPPLDLPLLERISIDPAIIAKAATPETMSRPPATHPADADGNPQALTAS